jgi:hypothetical protein
LLLLMLLHLLLVLLMSCVSLCHSLLLWIHLLLLQLLQMWRKTNGEALPHLPISYGLQLLCLCLRHVSHGHLVLEPHAHTTALLLSNHCLLLLMLSRQVCLLGGPLLLHHCRVHCHECQPLRRVPLDRTTHSLDFAAAAEIYAAHARAASAVEHARWVPPCPVACPSSVLLG